MLLWELIPDKNGGMVPASEGLEHVHNDVVDDGAEGAVFSEGDDVTVSNEVEPNQVSVHVIVVGSDDVDVSGNLDGPGVIGGGVGAEETAFVVPKISIATVHERDAFGCVDAGVAICGSRRQFSTNLRVSAAPFTQCLPADHQEKDGQTQEEADEGERV